MRDLLLIRLSSLVIMVWQSLPIPIIHNLSKATTLKKIFWQQNLDGVEGDYFEFGVAHGNSMQSAIIANKKAESKLLGVSRIERNFFGFDTFESFVSSHHMDKHKTWSGDKFQMSYGKVSKRFKRHKNVYLYKLNVEQILKMPLPPELRNAGRAAVALFDMDLYGPTITALEWLLPRIQTGTYLIFDEYFAFRGDRHRGESRALEEFLMKHSSIELRSVMQYGAGGQVFVVSSMKLDR